MENGLFTDLVSKPVEPAELQEKIIRYSRLNGLGEALQNTRGDSSELNLDQVSDLMKDNPALIKSFLQKILDEFGVIQMRLNQGIENRDHQDLLQLEHKYKWSLDMLHLFDLHRHILHAIELLSQDAPEDQLSEAKTKGDLLIKQVKEGVKKRITEL